MSVVSTSTTSPTDPERPAGSVRLDVDAVVRLARVVPRAPLLLLEPPFHGVRTTVDGHWARGAGAERRRRTSAAEEGVGRRPGRAVHQQRTPRCRRRRRPPIEPPDPAAGAARRSAVDEPPADRPLSRPRRSRLTPGLLRRPRRRPPRSPARFARSQRRPLVDRADVGAASGRTMASTVNDASSAPASSWTRHSAWVMPSGRPTSSWWWYSIHQSARTSRWKAIEMALIAHRQRCGGPRPGRSRRGVARAAAIEPCGR